MGRFVRQSKQQWQHHRPGVPAGLLAGLAVIESVLPDGCHATEPAERSGLDPSTVSRAIAGLVEHGLVAGRADSGGRRATALQVTEALADARDWFATFRRQALVGWQPSEVTAFAGSLERFLSDARSRHRDWEAAR
ncbi:MarR family transcriptional regulator [Actinoplanes sp. NPDC026619]|uniref:MarR family winged helix-turn-helix transcriptional regulator n=1 Tax=Actinoplanes sp. NPDC026619 TaxID=3155798 RepID=UPI0033D9B35C